MTTTKTSSAASSINATATSSKRLSGLVSGLDTDTLVKQLTSGTQSKINKQQQNKQLAVWRQQSYREVIKALSEFKSKYLSSSNSSSSIASGSFFNATSIGNTSSFLNVSGSAAAAKNMVITQISQLAKQASLASSHAVSDGTLTTGALAENMTQNALSGASVTITYGGKDYSVALDSDFTFTSSDAQEQLAQITDTLNYKISKTAGLAGNVKFGMDGGKVTLSKTESAAGQITLKDGSENLLNGLGLLAQKGTAADSITGAETNNAYFFKNTIAAGSKLEFTIDGSNYTLNLSNAVSLPVGNSAETNRLLQASLKSAIAASPDLNQKLDVSIDEATGAVAFTAMNGASLQVSGGSQNLLNGLGLTAGEGDYRTAGTVSQSELIQTHLSDALAGATLTFSLNGLNKNITFDENDKADYQDPEKLKGYLQTKLDAAYGEGKVKVAADENNALRFSLTSSTSATDIFTLVSSDKSGVLGMGGVLHTYAGESNRLNTSKTLADLSANAPAGYANVGTKPTNLATSLTGDTSYEINVNGKAFTFQDTASVSDIITTISNDSDANVAISYSSTTNTFSATAKDGGSTSKVEISDVHGNLAQALFGTAGERAVQQGQDAVMSISFDGDPTHATTVTRSSNTFTLDDVNFELLQQTNSTVSADTPIQFTVKNQTDDLSKKISDFVTDYNNILDLINGKVTEKKPTDETYLPLTDDQKAEMSETQIANWETQAKKGLLQGDSILDSLSTSLRRAMTDQVTSIGSALYQFGIATKDYTQNGKLTVDEDKLEAALSSSPDKLAALFTGADGIAGRLQSVIQSNINPSMVDTGILVQKAGSDDSTSTVDNSTLAQNIRDYESQIKDLKTRLESEQDRYYNQFTQMETYLSKMNSYAGFFSSDSSSHS